MEKELSRLMIGIWKFCLSFGLWVGLFSCTANADESAVLSVVWNVSGVHQNLKSWKVSDLRGLKKTISRERDPQTGRNLKWEGVLMSSFLDTVLDSLPPDYRAQVDLVVLKNRSGQRAFIPRAMIVKYPLLLGFQRGGMDLDGKQETLHSVVPWSSKPRILNEDLPVESFYLSDVTQLELTNYRDRFSPFFLKRRTDPSAIRGEKLFVQNCVSCHTVERTLSNSSLVSWMDRINLEGGAEKLDSKGHPTGTYSTKLSDRDRKSIVRYLKARRLENPLSVSQAIPSVDSRTHEASNQ